MKSIYEFLRFCLVGVIATGFHYGVYALLLLLFDTDYKIITNISYTIGYLISWFLNFIMTTYFTFRSNISFRKGVGFAVCHLINYLLHIGFLNLFLWIGISEKIAPIPVYCCVIPINFLLVRTVFKSKKIQ